MAYPLQVGPSSSQEHIAVPAGDAVIPALKRLGYSHVVPAGTNVDTVDTVTCEQKTGRRNGVQEMFDSLGEYEPPLDLLMQLASTRLDREEFNAACRGLPEFHQSHYGHDAYIISATRQVGIRLVANRVTARVEHARMLLCLFRPWAVYAEKMTPDDALDYDRFNARYRRYYEIALRDIGPPTVEGREPDGWRYRFAIWRTNAGYLALAQSDIDLIIGHDISYWIRYSDRELPRRLERFNDWLAWEFPVD